MSDFSNFFGFFLLFDVGYYFIVNEIIIMLSLFNFLYLILKLYFFSDPLTF